MHAQRSDADAPDQILTGWVADFGLGDAVAFDGNTVPVPSADRPARHLMAVVVHGTTRRPKSLMLGFCKFRGWLLIRESVGTIVRSPVDLKVIKVIFGN